MENTHHQFVRYTCFVDRRWRSMKRISNTIVCHCTIDYLYTFSCLYVLRNIAIYWYMLYLGPNPRIVMRKKQLCTSVTHYQIKKKLNSPEHNISYSTFNYIAAVFHSIQVSNMFVYAFYGDFCCWPVFFAFAVPFFPSIHIQRLKSRINIIFMSTFHTESNLSCGRGVIEQENIYGFHSSYSFPFTGNINFKGRMENCVRTETTANMYFFSLLVSFGLNKQSWFMIIIIIKNEQNYWWYCFTQKPLQTQYFGEG